MTSGSTSRLLIASACLLAAQGRAPARRPVPVCSVDQHAREYVDLVASLGADDPPSVDSSLPAPAKPLALSVIAARAQGLGAHLQRAHGGDSRDSANPGGARTDAPRVASLIRQLDAVAARAEQLGGRRLSLADEMRRLLARPVQGGGGADDPPLERLLPGPGPLARRLEAHDRRFAVPAARLPAVMARAVRGCRDATRDWVRLPDGETLTVTYVDGATWSGDSRYVGGRRSVMQINTRLALTVDRVLDLACHEGYPGHHTLNLLRDEHLRAGRGWVEAAVLPIFSPASYALEALASAAPDLAFPADRRVAFERDVLFPLAGLDPRLAAWHVAVSGAVKALDADVAQVTTAYLDGALDRPRAAAALERRAHMAHPEATLHFIDVYRAYSTAYTAGRRDAWQSVDRTLPPWQQWARYLSMGVAATLDAERAEQVWP